MNPCFLMFLSQDCQLHSQTLSQNLHGKELFFFFFLFSETLCHRFNLNLIACFQVFCPMKAYFKPMLHKHPPFLCFIHILVAGRKLKVNLREILGYFVFPVNGEGLLYGLTGWVEYFKFGGAQSKGT